MASIAIILSKEKVDNKVIHLYKEGIFLKAYAYSAYLFVRHLKDYQVKTRYLKIINKWVCSIGFPAASLGIFSNEYTIQPTELGVDILLNESIDEESYLNWEKDHIRRQEAMITGQNALQNEREKILHPTGTVVFTDTNYERLRMHILSFDLANKTPIECSLFLSETQKQLLKEQILCT